MKRVRGIRSFLSLLLVFAMLFSMTPVVNAEEAENQSYESVVTEEVETVTEGEVEGEDIITESDDVVTGGEEDKSAEEFVDESKDETVTTVETEGNTTVTTEGEPVMATAEEGEETTYSVTVHEGVANGTVTTSVEKAVEGDTVTVTAIPNEECVLTQVAYRTVAEDGTKGKTVEVSAVDGAYTFTMPASAVEVGAAFQPEGDTVLTNSGTSGNTLGIVGSKENNYSVYIANWDAFIQEDATEVNVYLSFDKRFLDIEGVTMTLESRQYGEKGYTVVGKQTYSAEELKELVKNAEDTGSEYIINSIAVPVLDGKSYTAGQAMYCVAQFGCPTWVDAFGDALYRWNYTGVDATIIEEDAAIPTPIVWLYNLDANSYRGSVVRNVLADLGVEAGTVNNDNLGQNIGYLVGWDGYEPVENPYHSGEYDVEYMLMGNLSDAQMDLLLKAMDENNIYVALKSIPTAWTASKTFVELFEIMAEESEVLQEAVALDKMIYTAEQLDEETYGNSEYWAELQKELAEALVALQTDAEETGLGAGLYRDARLELEKVYLLVTGKTILEGELELILEELEDGTYKVTAQLNGELENPTFTYNWEPAKSSEEAEKEYLIVAKEDLYKVSLDITATGDFYGTMSETLYVPADPQFSATSTKDSITVELEKDEAAHNTPETEGYVVELYLDGELVQSTEVTSSNKVVFNGLNEETEYVLKVNSYNLIGRSNIVEATISTSEEGETVLPEDTTPEDEDTTKPDETLPEDDKTTGIIGDKDSETSDDNKLTEKTEGTEKETESNSVKTGDNSTALIWMLMLMVSALCLGGFAVLTVKRRQNR